MISRRSYLAIAAVMLVVLFMFQFTNVALELWNDYEENEHALDVSSLMDRDDAFTPGDASPLGAARPGVAFIGSSGSAMEQPGPPTQSGSIPPAPVWRHSLRDPRSRS